jgi:hypothetical protein
MEYAIGIGLALGVAAFARIAGLDRDRAFYPTLAIAVASYYVLFAAMSGHEHVLHTEVVVAAAFVGVAVLGFRSSSWFVVAALAAHGVLDAFHGHVVANPGVPEWWPAFCAAFDVSAAGVLALRLACRGVARRRQRAALVAPRVVDGAHVAAE